MPFAACQSNGFTSMTSSVSSYLFIVLFVLLLSGPFLDLWDLPLVVVMMGLRVSVMQPCDYYMGQIESDRLKGQYIGQGLR